MTGGVTTGGSGFGGFGLGFGAGGRVWRGALRSGRPGPSRAGPSRAGKIAGRPSSRPNGSMTFGQAAGANTTKAMFRRPSRSRENLPDPARRQSQVRQLRAGRNSIGRARSANAWSVGRVGDLRWGRGSSGRAGSQISGPPGPMATRPGESTQPGDLGPERLTSRPGPGDTGPGRLGQH